MHHRLGRKAAADDRDRKFAIRATGPLAGRKRWRRSRERLPQPGVPHCVGYAWARWLLWPPFGQQLSPSGVYYAAQRVDEWEGEDYEGTSVRAGAKVLAELGFVREYRWALDVETMAAAVRYDGPLVIGTNWYERMDQVDDRGFARVRGRNLGGHAYNVYGVDCGGEYFEVCTPWEGTAFGIDGSGDARVSFADMRRLIVEEGEICLPVEQEARAA